MEPAPAEHGHLVLFLHAHLPYVRHPAYEDFLEEDWLYEVITETYVPLLAAGEGWLRDGVRARITLSLSPPLMEMLCDDLLVERYVRRSRRLLRLAESEVRRTAGDERFSSTAEMYRDRLADTLERFERRYGRDLIGAFGALQDAGVLEVVTTCATHAFLPCFDIGYARAQVRVGVKCYQKHFGCSPKGMWLPECGFVPGIDAVLAEEGITYFFVDAHGVENGDPRPLYGTYSPIVCPSGVFAFARDLESSARVWSAESGYPGDGRYREFYRDIGHDLDDASLAPFRLPDGARRNVGVKYHRVTGRSVPLHEKEPYDRAAALAAVAEHAGDFVRGRAERIERCRGAIDRAPVLAAPYDAELFGHWWFEGPEFLDAVVRIVDRERPGYRLSTPTDVMDSGLDFQVAMPAASSWGAYGYSNTWLNDTNDWIWPHLHHATAEMARLAGEHPRAEGIERRALNQLAREVVLATASDWPFLITMGTAVDYASGRVRTHVGRANRLVRDLDAQTIDEGWLRVVEAQDNIFADIDYRDFAVRAADTAQGSPCGEGVTSTTPWPGASS